MQKQRPLYLLLCLIIYSLLAWAQWRQPRVLEDLRNFGFDTFQRLDPPAYEPESPVRIVAIDERSLAERGQWPWPRIRLAEMVERLTALGAAAIGFDMIFAESDRTSLEAVVQALPDGALKAEIAGRLDAADSNDSRFAKILAAAPTVLGATMQGHGAAESWDPKAGFAVAGDSPNAFLPAFESVVLPIPVLRDASPGLGATNWLPDRDQIVRRVPLVLRQGDAILPSLAMETLRVAQGASTFVLRAANASGTTSFGKDTGLSAIKVGEIEVETSPDGAVRPRYTRSAPERYLSATDLLAGRIGPDAVRGKLILIGTTAIGLGDVRATPLGAVVPGVEIHAQVLEQLLAGHLLSRPDWAPGAEYLGTLAMLAALIMLFPRVPPLIGAIVATGIVAVLNGGSWVAFDRYGILLDAGVPSAAIVVTYLGSASILWQTEQRAKRLVRAAFGKFVAPAVVDKIAENPKLLVLSGETRELTILFADLRSFSTISEGLEAHEVARFLNGYLTPMTDVILANDGTVDKYIGDAIVAFWNAPLDVLAHTRRAVEATLAMRQALTAFNGRQALRKESDPRAVQDVRMGIGLNVGDCSVGNMGSVQRFDYSALGDPVNVAARLEALTKTYGVDVLASPAVQDRTSGFAWLEVDEVRVKGRKARTKLFTLIGDERFATSSRFAEWRASHTAMLDAKLAGRSNEAHASALRLLAGCEPRWRPLYQALAGLYAAAIETEMGESASPALTQVLRSS